MVWIILLIIMGAFLISNLMALKIKKETERIFLMKKRWKLTGEELFEKLKSEYNLKDVKLEKIKDSIHAGYQVNQKTKKIIIGDLLCDSGNVYALWSMAHEGMHAIQEKKKYWAMTLERDAKVIIMFLKYIILPILIVLGLLGEFNIYNIHSYNIDFVLVIIYIITVLLSLTTTLMLEVDANQESLKYLKNKNYYKDKEDEKLIKKIVKLSLFLYIFSILKIYKI